MLTKWHNYTWPWNEKVSVLWLIFEIVLAILTSNKKRAFNSLFGCVRKTFSPRRTIRDSALGTTLQTRIIHFHPSLSTDYWLVFSQSSYPIKMKLEISACCGRFKTKHNTKQSTDRAALIHAGVENCTVSTGTGGAPVAFSSCQLQSPHPYTRARTWHLKTRQTNNGLLAGMQWKETQVV